MIDQPEVRPIFRYAYRPLGIRHDPEDGGFSVTLYSNDRLAFNQVDGYMRSKILLWFEASPEIRANYFAMLDHADWWLNMTPKAMQAATPQYSSMFGYDGQRAIIVQDLVEMAQEPFLTPNGHYARHLYALHEDMADMMLHYGFYMQVDGFTWDTRLVSSIPQPQLRDEAWTGHAVNF